MPMSRLQPSRPVVEPGRKWRYRAGERAGAPSVTDPRRTVLELVLTPDQRREAVTAVAGLCASLRTRDDYVICIDSRTLAAQAGVSEGALRGCLTELARVGAISGCLGNLVFFD